MSATRSSSRWKESVVVAAVFGAAALIVWPRGEFPLNDDWNFALTTWHLADTGHFVFSRYAAMSLRAQAIWGAVWTLIFGRSFEILRCSTLLLSAGTLLLVDGALRRLQIDRPLRLLATLALLFHPIFFWSSFTYMTQVPYVFVSVLAMTLFLRGFAEDDSLMFVAGAAAVVVSYFIRQTGVVNALPPLAALLLTRPPTRDRNSRLFICALPIALFAALFFFTPLLVGNDAEFAGHLSSWRSGNPVVHGAVVLFRHITFNFQNAALFFLPLTWLGLRSFSSLRPARWLCAIFLFLFSVRAAELILSGAPMPYFAAGLSSIQRGNVFVNLGLGPQTLRDVWVLGFEYPLSLSWAARVVLTVVTACGGAMLLGWVCSELLSFTRGSKRDLPVQVPVVLLTTHALAGSLVLCISSIYFDRYALDSLWSLAILIPVVVQQRGLPRLGPAWAMLAIVGAFSILATQEYFSWNRARWRAFDFLQSRGVGLRQMDGGYEINQYLLGGFNGPGHLRLQGYSVVDDEYLLTFQPVPGYVVVGSFPYHGYLGLHRGAVFALKRSGDRVRRGSGTGITAMGSPLARSRELDNPLHHE